MKSTPNEVQRSSTKLRLAARIGLGFGAVIGIALLLGAMSIWAMRGSTRQARVLAQQEVPQVIVANNVERSSLLTMYEMRGYGLTEESNFLAGGRQHLVDVHKHLGAARDLAQSRGLGELEKAAGKATEKVDEYERLVEETVRLNQGIDACRTRLDTAAKAFMDACDGYLTAQNKAIAVDVQTNARTATIVERHTKSSGIQAVMNLGNSVRILAWRSQAERNPDHLLATDAVFAEIGTKLAELRPLTRQAANLQQLDRCLQAATSYHETLDTLAKDWRARDDISLRRNNVAQAVLAEARTVAENGLESTRTIATRTAEQLSTATLAVAMGVGIALVVSSIIALFLTRAVTLPIKRVADSITVGSEQTASAAAQVSAAGQSLAEGSSEQAASLEETSSSLEEMASMTKNNSESARKANQLAREAREAADRGAKDMAEMSQAMSDIKSSSDDIAKIIKTIDEIAFQTNILALNAAVEAARAGEAGMGFAVVADEVRALAQRSAQAAKETSAKIEGAIGRTSRGVDITRKVEEALHQIVAKAREVDELAGQVAAASNEQSQGISQLNLAVGQMDKVVQSNAANAEESASAAEELSAQAECLKEVATELRILVDGSGTAATASTTKANARSPRPAIAAGIGSTARLGEARNVMPAVSRNGIHGAASAPDHVPSGNGRADDSNGSFGSF